MADQLMGLLDMSSDSDSDVSDMIMLNMLCQLENNSSDEEASHSEDGDDNASDTATDDTPLAEEMGRIRRVDSIPSALLPEGHDSSPRRGYSCCSRCRPSPKPASNVLQIQIMQQQSQSQPQQCQHVRYDNDGINITPIVSLSEENRILQMGIQKDKLNSCIQTHVDRLNNQFIRVTNILAQEVTKNNLSVIKRLEKVLTSIESPAQARSFIFTKLQKKKRKVQAKSVARRKDMSNLKSLRIVNGRPGASDINTTQNTDEDNILKANATRKVRNFRTMKEVALPQPWPSPDV